MERVNLEYCQSPPKARENLERTLPSLINKNSKNNNPKLDFHRRNGAMGLKFEVGIYLDGKQPYLEYDL